MSLSQKHRGKVFVPWYNSSEWRKVYNLLCLQTEQNYSQALNILKIWKCRTPLLSAGVEGTLIILETLNENEQLSNAQVTHTLALSLMRFLNICAAHNEKQGTFYKTAVKNDLPKWLINIRHNIAHDHKLPSKSMLELSLRHCLEWIKVKYWEVQKEIITDYVVTDDSSNGEIIEILNIYIKLNMNLYFQVDINDYDQILREKIDHFNSKNYIDSKTDIKGMLIILEKVLKQLFAEPSNKSMSERIVKELVNVLLTVGIEVTPEGNEIIPKYFRNMWSNLLNILYENDIIFLLLNQFLEVTNNIMLEHSTRNVASLWINDIFQGLQKIRNIKEELDSIQMNNADELDSRTSTIVLKSVLNKKHPEYKDCLEFDSTNFICLADAEVFQKNVLNLPNKYTLNFLESVLKFNKSTENYITDATELVRKLMWSTVKLTDQRIFTTGDIGTICCDTNMEWSDSDKTEIISMDAAPPSNHFVNTRWTAVKDTSLYQGCPLGILPHQSRQHNPLLLL